jgi:hypothetical protein
VTEYATSGGATEANKSYAYPLRWTVTFMADHGHPLMARILRRMGRMDGEYRGITVTCETCQTFVTLPDEYSEAIARRALTVAAESFRSEPQARIITRDVA